MSQETVGKVSYVVCCVATPHPTFQLSGLVLTPVSLSQLECLADQV